MNDFVMGGEEEARQKFLQLMKNLIFLQDLMDPEERPLEQLRFVTKFLMEAVVENDVTDFDGTQRLLQRFGKNFFKIVSVFQKFQKVFSIFN